MTIQDAINDLYILTKNKSNQIWLLNLETIVGNIITVPYIETYPTISYVYGINENYGSKKT